MVKKSIYMGLLGLFSLMMWTSCQTVTFGGSAPNSPRILIEEYERSGAAERRKYDGKEIIVRGYAGLAPTMPQPGDDQGSVFLGEKESLNVRQLTCWFSRDQAEQFSTVKGGQYITVRGIFNGEAGADLKFCKLVKTEDSK